MGADPARGRPDPPASEDEIRRLRNRLRVEVGLTNAAGVAVLALALYVLEPPAREIVTGIPWALAFLVVVPLYALGVLLSHRLFRPLERWLRQGRAGEPAPERVRVLVLAHPALQALMLLALWLFTAVFLAVAHLTRDPDDPAVAFVSTLVGISIAGITVSTLSFLTTQRVLGPWYDRFFAGEDPTAHDVPSTRVGRRLFAAFALGAAVPMLLIGFAVSDRFADPGTLASVETVVWFLVAVGITTGLVLTLSVRQSITRPLRLIRHAADRVREGDLAVTVPVESPDEFGELAVAFNAMVEGLRERRRLEDLFGRHVGDAVAEKVLLDGVSFAGERRVATVLFLDLAGFSRLSEDLPPEGVVETLNRVFEVVIREVDRHDGLVNKFMGDAVLALFGAPFDDPEHAAHAVAAARAITTGLEPTGVAFGIGVSTGNVVAGNVGAEQRFEYTVVGDAVNEASRLQELTRERPERVLVSGRTVEALGDAAGLRALGEHHLRGRSAPTQIYAVG